MEFGVIEECEGAKIDFVDGEQYVGKFIGEAIGVATFMFTLLANM